MPSLLLVDGMEWVLEYRTAELTAFFKAVTTLGDVGFFMFFLAVGYWLWRPRTCARTILLLLGSAVVNVSLKELFAIPRPDVSPLIGAAGWSFPSGHAQTAATLWPWLALELGRHRRGGRSWRWPATAALVAGVAASRVYLGVHTPVDVFAGAAVGVLIVALAWWILHRPFEGWQDLGTHRQAAVVAVSAAAWCAIVLPTSVDPAAPAACGTLVGFWIGSLYRSGDPDFASASPWRTLAALMLGLGIALALRLGLKELAAFSSSTPWSDLVRYLVVGAWVGLGAPWLFRAASRGDRIPG